MKLTPPQLRDLGILSGAWHLNVNLSWEIGYYQFTSGETALWRIGNYAYLCVALSYMLHSMFYFKWALLTEFGTESHCLGYVGLEPTV